MSIYLCGHTGSMNHGCEAIVRSTCEIFNNIGYNENYNLLTFKIEEDAKYGLNKVATLIPYKTLPKYNIRRLSLSLLDKAFKTELSQKFRHRNLLDNICTNDICFVIGGDTYCYGEPKHNIALNKFMKAKNIPTVLWCCSIDKESITKNVLADLNNYSLIVAREEYTYCNLLDAGLSPDKLLKSCDCAFALPVQETALPDGFETENTIGLNISSCVIEKFDDTDAGYLNVVYLIKRILEDTNMKICLIPHVYDKELQNIDYNYNDKIRHMFDTDRICYVDHNYNCMQLKYIISKCKFFIGARTHATIAAYSTHVPTLVLGYSIKSKGIAKDIFGDDKGYVIDYNDLKTEYDLSKLFFDNIYYRENEIRNIYDKVIPSYSSSVSDAAKFIVDNFVK